MLATIGIRFLFMLRNKAERAGVGEERPANHVQADAIPSEKGRVL